MKMKTMIPLHAHQKGNMQGLPSAGKVRSNWYSHTVLITGSTTLDNSLVKPDKVMTQKFHLQTHNQEK
jgi:hypothetical protein